MNEAIQLIIFLVALVAIAPLLGKYQERRRDELEDLSIWYAPFQPVWYGAFISNTSIPGLFAAQHRTFAERIVASGI